ncbi:spore germination protein [Clostridium fallax]|uniref:Spore germination protein n=1 Tax=Clostridium fallax TaxID=1533 RepID=A0A1M4SWW5_9CLOT|nr:spore germination protein [Clostridium fallax]SHE36711.1 spore germination protein [Clostridium fallax]SQB08010.1 spore germination protein KA [Clostridium fallax]
MEKKLKFFKDRLKDSFDVKYREVDTALGKATCIFIDVLCGTSFVSEYIVKPLVLEKEHVFTLKDICCKVLSINTVGYPKDDEDALLHILSGDVIIIFENEKGMIYCEAKNIASRGVGIPVTESVLKGPREGFTELFVDNVALIRKRVKNSDLKFEAIYVGEKSKTVVCVTYIQGLAPKELIDYVRSKIKELDYQFILDTNYIEDKLRYKNTVFDTVGYTEKPDETVAKLMEGRVGVIVDGTPFVITTPFFFLENFHMPDDYYLNKYFVNFTRTLRWIAFFIATFMPGIYVATICYHYSMIPSLFVFRLAVSRAGVPFPTIIEVLIMMTFFQLIKEAGLRLPQPIGTAMSIVAALILGDAAVGAGLASRITILVIAISALSYFLIPKSYGAMSIWSIIIVLFSAFLGLPGFFAATLLLVTHLANLKSSGYSYLFPIGTAKEYKFKDLVFRGNLDNISKKVIEEDDIDEKKL